jgi:hypothetical protein
MEYSKLAGNTRTLLACLLAAALIGCTKQPSAAAISLREKAVECLASLATENCSSLINITPVLKKAPGASESCKVSADRLASAAYRVGSQTAAERSSPYLEGSPLHRLLLERDRRLLALRESLATFKKECLT